VDIGNSVGWISSGFEFMLRVLKADFKWVRRKLKFAEISVVFSKKVSKIVSFMVYFNYFVLK